MKMKSRVNTLVPEFLLMPGLSFWKKDRIFDSEVQRFVNYLITT